MHKDDVSWLYSLKIHIDCANGVTTASKAHQLGCFDRQKQFLTDFGCFDQFLIDFEQKERVSLICTFEGSVRHNEFGTTNKPYLLHRTVSSTVSNVYSISRTNLWNYPSLEDTGIKSIVLNACSEIINLITQKLSTKSTFHLLFSKQCGKIIKP